ARAVRGNADDGWSRGHLCPKGASLQQIHHDPNRLRQPLVRTASGEHLPVSWEDAFAETERVLRPVLDRYGARAVTVYIGNPVAHNLALETYVGALIGMAG
ncbi:molybdopterin dinucleotide-binding protein, partial [Enterococcus faecium]